MRARVAIVHPLLAWGGSEAVVLWAVEALKDDYDVYLITPGRVDLERLNAYYGTKLAQKELSIIEISLPFLLRHTTRFAALRGALVARFCEKISRSFDVMFGAYNPMDFGAKGIQYIQDFSFDERLRRTLDPAPSGWRGWWYADSVLRRLYLKLTENLAHSSYGAWKNNLTLVNSRWSARLMKETYGIVAHVVYPPVAGDFPNIPWQEREDGFVCIGRVVPEKRMNLVIEILGEVQQRDYPIHLHILGKLGGDPHYAKRMKQLCAENQEWVSLDDGVYGQRKLEFLARHKYGINAREAEPFGIAVAEMVKAGCIVFVPEGGGQVEIVDHPSLIYKNVEDAVQKIERVLEKPEMQSTLRQHLSMEAQRFSVENFQKDIRDVINEFLHQQR